MKNFQTFQWQEIYDWYQKNGWKKFLWRDYQVEEKNLIYRVWLAEILLQQTQAERVVGFYKKILEKFPTISELANSDYNEFFPYYQGLWYYSRARNLLKTAKIISEDFDGIFPKDKKLLKKLPWIGEYTSSAILAFWYGKPVLAFDTNLEKIFSRYYFGDKKQKLNNEEKISINKQFQDFVSTFPHTKQKTIIRDINNGLMDFSRMIESQNPEKINWENYPIKSGKFYENKWKSEVNSKKKAENFPIPDAKIIVILHENHKIYFWENHLEYSPFILPASLNRDTRNFEACVGS